MPSRQLTNFSPVETERHSSIFMGFVGLAFGRTRVEEAGREGGGGGAFEGKGGAE